MKNLCFSSFIEHLRLKIFFWQFSELKRQLKAQKKADEKGQKAPVAQPTAAKAKPDATSATTADDDEHIDPNVSD